MTGTEVATTGSFTGADVDGLDKLAHDFTAAAQVVDMVKTACEIIVAAASFFGPFAAAFIAYLKGTVIPWLTKISEALKAMSKVLSIHSQAQKDTSSSATSLPSYTGTTNLPTTSTTNAPQIGGSVAPAAPVSGPATPPASTVTAPPTIGGSTGATTGTAGSTTGTGTIGSKVDTIVKEITAATGLITAIDHLIHPGSSNSPATPGTGSTPVGTTPPTPGGTVPVGGDVLGATGTLGGSGGIDLSAFKPLHPGDTIGVISVPVDIAPDGTVTPLVHTPLVPTPATPGHDVHPAISASDTGVVHAASAPLTTHAASLGSSGLGSGGGGGSFGGGGSSVPSGLGDSSTPTVSATTPTLGQSDATLAAHTTPTADPEVRTQTIGSHDGLFSGLGQATGIGAGAAALARAVLHEAKQGANGSMVGATPSPFDSGSDASARSEIFSGSIS